jgi:hypothetical protein
LVHFLGEQKMNKERFQDKESNMLFGQAKEMNKYTLGKQKK